MSSKIALAIRLLLFVFFTGFFGSASFAATLVGSEVGAALDGSTVSVPGGYDLTSRSSQIGGNADQLHFAAEQRTGDFDVQVRVQGVSVTDAFVQAGLLARESLEPGARFAAALATTAQVGTYFESRVSASGGAQVTTPVVFPVNYPQMFLRLRRSGNVFTGFASFDGEKWHQLGTANMGLGSTIYLGVGVCSQNTNLVATAKFRDYRDTQQKGVFTYRQTNEPLGPANRYTGMVFSEIMYHPGPQAGTNDIEFIELYNGESIFKDLSGWKISGGVEFEFPAGFTLQAGQFAVIAADPAAIARFYGYTNALGPYSGRLNNGGDTVRLLNAAGAVRLEVKYSPDAPWPVPADGAGHSIVLARPSYGEGDPRAWSASAIAGGSPGEVDAIRPSPLQSVLINEFLAHTDDPVLDFIELYNAGTNAVDISGCVLTDNIGTNKFVVPPGSILQPRGFASFDQNQLHFSLSAGGETIYLLSPSGDRILDVVRFGGQENGVSSGRSPDGSPTIRRLSQPTPGAANASWRIEDVVINEIMYDPLSGDEEDQYVEIFNRSDKSIDLSGWTLADAVSYRFPEGTTIPAQGYFVVGKNAGRLLANYTQLNTNNTFGNFSGKLSGSGEHLALKKRDYTLSTNELGVVLTNTIHITVSEVSWLPGGRWADLAHGGGSSLELIDPRADTLRAGNWAASDETQKAGWTTVEFTGRLDLGQNRYPANRMQVIMLGAGECLIDDIEFVPTGSTNLMINGDFENPTNQWKFFGNHSLSAVETDNNGQHVLHVRAQDNGDTGNNSIRGDMYRSVTSGTATIRAKVRWLSGWPEVLLRVRGGWIEYPVRMDVPKNPGTPGLPNSRRVPNAGPAIFDVTHTPALPRANEAVTVTCRFSDPDGIAQPVVRYRVDPNQGLTTVAMRDDGFAGDLLAGDGIYTATIPGQGSGALVAFRVEVADDSAQSARSVFPDDAPQRECLIKWNDNVPFGNFRHYHMWSTAATEAKRSSSNGLNNTYRDATLVYGNWRVIYNAGFRDKGSPFHSGFGDFAVEVPADDLLLGTTDRIFASTGNGGNEPTDMAGDVAGWVGEQMGIPFLHSHYMRLYRNGGLFREVMYDMEQPSRAMAKSWFGGGGLKDDLFKISVWFEYDDSNSPSSGTGASTSATLQRFLSDGKYKLARYRWNWEIRPGNETANDYTSIFNLAEAANSSTLRTRTLPILADVEEWMRVFAYDRILGNWDSWSYNVGQNMYLYTPLGQPSKLMPWDIDFVLGQGDGPTSSLFTAGEDSTVQSLFNLPLYRRMLWRAYQDAMNTALQTTNFQPQIDARRIALSKNGVTGVTSPGSISTYMNSRRNYIATQLRNSDAAGFAITTNGGADINATDSTVTLSGYAPFAVASIEVNGIPYPVNWISVTNWQVTVPLGAATNVLQLVGRDLRGGVVTGALDTVNVTYSGAIPQARDWVVINEIMYNPAEPNAGFIELHNTHPTFAFDLTGMKLRGVDFTFPPGTLIQPNNYLVIAENAAAFAAAYGATIPVVGTYSGKLQHGGETLRLVQILPEGQEIVMDDVRYDNTAPWPALADGFGPSLQLIDPGQDNWRVGNWGVTDTNDTRRATPGQVNAIRSSIPAFPPLWLNEIQPVNTNSAVADNTGRPEPWIELFNAGTTNIDLSGFFLSDDPALPAKWQFEAGTRLGPGQFLRVWADGEPQQSTATELHTSFRISGTNGVVLLSRSQNSGVAVMDYVKYQVTSLRNSYGSYPDGEPRKRRQLYLPTPGAPNSATIPGIQVYINEWMAGTQSTVRDPADGQYQDWFELFNAGSNTVDLSGYFLSDATNNPTAFQIPAGFQIPPNSFRLIWADGEPEQNAPGRDLHVNFSLKASGEQIGLFTPDGQVVDLISFGVQTDNVSEGRYPDGAREPFQSFLLPTPGTNNVNRFANQAPVITAVSDRTVNEGEVLTLRVQATDSDIPAQTLTFSLFNAPDGARINPQTGEFFWTPSEAQGPGTYTITVVATDNGLPVRSSATSFCVTVQEVNQLPTLPSIADISVDEGSLLDFTVRALDADLPPQALTFSLAPGAPAGASIDPQTGEFQWTPTEGQGGRDYSIAVLVADNVEPNRFASRTFVVHVRAVNNPPVIESVDAQSMDEGTTFTLQMVAHDPETPPAKLTWSLDSAPAGMQINPDTGLITWLAGESAGPGLYNITVRVSEPGGSPSSRVNFLLGVREVNTPPTLAAVADIVAGPNQLIVVTNRAQDVDLPAQSITFSGNLPAGATLDPATGVFTWQLSDDPPAGTNQVRITVTDDGSPALATNITFNIVVQAPVRVVINEIMHRPAVTNAQFVELANLSQNNSVDLSGWRLSGYDFNFPQGTILPAGGFLCVAPDTNQFRAAYGTGPAVVGPASRSIAAEGGLLRLLQPSSGGGFNLVDEVAFSLDAPWPAAARQGASLQLIDPSQDHRRAINWGASTGGAVTNPPATVLPIEAAWRYWQAGTLPAADWTSPAFDDSSWPSGGALLYVENAALPAAKTTPLTLGRMAYYFRTRFSFNGSPIGAALRLRTVIDDGAIFYLNGREIFRIGMPEGAVTPETPASRTVGDAAYEGPFEIPGESLLQGENVLAVEVHQANSGSSDIVLGATMDVITVAPLSATPGAPNSIRQALPAIPPVWVNEVLAENSTGLTDGAGEHEPWIELFNASFSPVNLAGWTLSDDLANLAKWEFPSGVTIPARGYLLIWADGNAQSSTTSELHTSFRLAPGSGSVALAIRQFGTPVLADYLKYGGVLINQSFGSLNQGDPALRSVLSIPTPGSVNAEAGSQNITASIQRNGTLLAIRWTSEAGRRYQVQSSDNLAGAQWRIVFDSSGTGGGIEYIETLDAKTAARFYRVVVP